MYLHFSVALLDDPLCPLVSIEPPRVPVREVEQLVQCLGVHRTACVKDPRPFGDESALGGVLVLNFDVHVLVRYAKAVHSRKVVVGTLPKVGEISKAADDNFVSTEKIVRLKLIFGKQFLALLLTYRCFSSMHFRLEQFSINAGWQVAMVVSSGKISQSLGLTKTISSVQLPGYCLGSWAGLLGPITER